MSTVRQRQPERATLDYVCPDGEACLAPGCIAERARRRWWIITGRMRRDRAIGIFYLVRARVLAVDEDQARRELRKAYEPEGSPLRVAAEESGG